jgi:hypothetical protein
MGLLSRVADWLRKIDNAGYSADQGLLVVRPRADRDGDKAIQLSDHLPVGAFEAQIDAASSDVAAGRRRPC